jgi:hypothetical protein
LSHGLFKTDAADDNADPADSETANEMLEDKEESQHTGLNREEPVGGPSEARETVQLQLVIVKIPNPLILFS